MKLTNQTEIIYHSPNNTVTVVRTRHGLKRYPHSKYACVLFLLKPKEGTRVRLNDDGSVEFMSSFDELRAFLGAIDPKLGEMMPAEFKNKPLARKQKFDHWNARRH
jgi:hypothetical protein